MALRLPVWNFSGLCGFGQQWGPPNWAAAGLGYCEKIRVHTWCPWGSCPPLPFLLLLQLAEDAPRCVPVPGQPYFP